MLPFSKQNYEQRIQIFVRKYAIEFAVHSPVSFPICEHKVRIKRFINWTLSVALTAKTRRNIDQMYGQKVFKTFKTFAAFWLARGASIVKVCSTSDRTHQRRKKCLCWKKPGAQKLLHIEYMDSRYMCVREATNHAKTHTLTLTWADGGVNVLQDIVLFLFCFWIGSIEKYCPSPRQWAHIWCLKKANRTGFLPLFLINWLLYY